MEERVRKGECEGREGRVMEGGEGDGGSSHTRLH